MSIQKDWYVACTYDLYVDNDNDLVERATAEVPLKYVHGTGTMLPAFERELDGLNVGDKFDFSIEAEEAYGKHNKDYVIALDKAIFTNEEGQFDAKRVVVGQALPMMDSEGHPMTGIVVEIQDEKVVMDFNHPLADEKLHFKGEIIEARESTQEDKEMIEAIMNSGHEGGCGDDGCDSCGGGCGCH